MNSSNNPGIMGGMLYIAPNWPAPFQPDGKQSARR
jgi:hypothetical protein